MIYPESETYQGMRVMFNEGNLSSETDENNDRCNVH